MNIQELVKNSVGEEQLASLGQRFGLDPRTTQDLVDKLVPTIAGGARRKAQQEGGMTELLRNLRGEQQARYVDEPAEAAEPQARQQGEDFLSSILGSPAAPREVASAAADRTGAGLDAVVQFLPALAAIIQGVLQRNAPDAEIDAAQSRLAAGGDRAGSGINDLLSQLQGTGSGGLGGLVGGAIGSLLGGGGNAGSRPADGGRLGDLLAGLDKDGDGSPLDDILQSVMR